jgi:GNAT superfamily N-acetyltransferase
MKQLERIVSSRRFWELYDAQESERSFMISRNSLLDAFVEGHLWSIAGELCFFALNPAEPLHALLWVHPKYRKRGFGSFLVSQVLTRQYPTIEIMCIFPSAKGFWEKQGFMEWKGGSDTILMKRRPNLL